MPPNSRSLNSEFVEMLAGVQSPLESLFRTYGKQMKDQVPCAFRHRLSEHISWLTRCFRFRCPAIPRSRVARHKRAFGYFGFH